jgi:hypothetical protein
MKNIKINGKIKQQEASEKQAMAQQQNNLKNQPALQQQNNLNNSNRRKNL